MFYIDTSAFLKLFVAEEHAASARSALRRRDLGSSTLLDVEAHRAARRLGIDLAVVVRYLTPVALLTPSATTFTTARLIGSENLRSLDALHLATALELGGDLEGIVTYDRRVAADAAALGMDVEAPGLEPDWWTAG